MLIWLPRALGIERALRIVHLVYVAWHWFRSSRWQSRLSAWSCSASPGPAYRLGASLPTAYAIMRWAEYIGLVALLIGTGGARVRLPPAEMERRDRLGAGARHRADHHRDPADVAAARADACR